MRQFQSPTQSYSRVMLTVAPWQVTTVRKTVTRAPKALLTSIVSSACAPIAPRLIPVCEGRSRTRPSLGPVEPLVLNWLGGVKN
jgi:hypothetical protein